MTDEQWNKAIERFKQFKDDEMVAPFDLCKVLALAIWSVVDKSPEEVLAANAHLKQAEAEAAIAAARARRDRVPGIE